VIGPSRPVAPFSGTQEDGLANGDRGMRGRRLRGEMTLATLAALGM